MNLTDTPIVQRAMQVSPNINDYFVEQRYIGELEQEELRTPQNIELIAINLVLDELVEMGFETNYNAADLVESSFDRNVMFSIREIFDKDDFYKRLKSLPDESYSEFSAIIENITVPADFFFDIIEFFSMKTPNDERWNELMMSVEHWCTTALFSRHLTAIMNQIELHSDPNKAVVVDDNITDVTLFLKKFATTISKLSLITAAYLKSIRNLNGMVIQDYIKKYDREKLMPDNLTKFAEYSAHPTDTEPEFVVKHHETTWHHLEYWEKHINEYVPNREQLTIIVASLVIDGIRMPELKQKLTFIYRALPKEEQQLLQLLVSADFDDILGVNHAIK